MHAPAQQPKNKLPRQARTVRIGMHIERSLSLFVPCVRQ
jgi:hypothetical protein